MSSFQPKARYHSRINKKDYLRVTIWAGKSDPAAEVLVTQIKQNNEENQETIGRLAIYRAPDGNYLKLPECQE